VSLPTGLGKTLIAAVVMYNYYRWFPEGKIVFLAPTRPLVSQQLDACYKVMKIPERDTAEITGRQKTREILWSNRRVFFCTPQTFQKDIEENRCDARKIVCICFDEAHKATGKYAYARVIDMVESAGAKFRVVSLF
jgi:Fanconi anemia group M protein